MISKTRQILIPLLLSIFMLQFSNVLAEDGYRAWLRYEQVQDQAKLNSYRTHIKQVVVNDKSATMKAIKQEMNRALPGLLGTEVPFVDAVESDGTLIAGTPENSDFIASLKLKKDFKNLNAEGFLIKQQKVKGNEVTVVAAKTDVGVLYGVFHLFRLMQTRQTIEDLDLQSSPKIQHRILNHWDNLNRLVERGYAGLSLWEWGTLPEFKKPRYTDYARLNASMGINGTVLNNVNADPRILTDQFINKVEALAEVFRPYGIKVYLSVNFQSPMRVGPLETADPLDPNVRQWWADKATEIYERIPDFGGFLVKADSEGQPGPFKYDRNHAEGANMLAEAVEPHGGIVIWRAFVYSPEQNDRFREAYDEFVPLDGKFKDNVLLQVKNGPIDFQPREPFSPLFGAMEKTNTMLELQITQEYFGFDKHLAYQGPLFTEALDADTYAKGEGSTVGDVISGEVFDYNHTGMAGVVNLGTARNWTGHPFVQSSWYAFGRLAWDYTLSAKEIADEWLGMTFSNNREFVSTVKDIMMVSREAGVNYRMPLGLTHLYAQGHHYGPAPWTSDLPRADWTAVYYHKADSQGIGFDRTQSGSYAVEQYNEPLKTKYSKPETTPEEYLLWFHHLPWDYEMNSGRTLWEELVHKYYKGVEQVRLMQEQWNTMEGTIDKERFQHVKALLELQEEDAIWWRNACVLYFQSINGKAIPDQYEKPEHDLEYYKKLEKTKYIPAPRYY